MTDEFDPIWRALLEWLGTFSGSTDVERHVRLVHNAAGRGLVARSNLPPSTLLISIPNAALLNLYTLTPLYPPSFTLNGRLNATQLIALHLALQFRRHLGSDTAVATATAEARSSDPKDKGKARVGPSPADVDPRDMFWPFLATLPRSFASHPLTWSIQSRSDGELAGKYTIHGDDVAIAGTVPRSTRERVKFSNLLEAMPRALRNRVEEVEKRFRADWNAVMRVWADSSSRTELGRDAEFGFYDFLLGWLNVNTRCIYFDLPATRDSPKHWSKKENSLTLCPVIDMINHKASLATKPHPTSNALTFSSPSRSSTDANLVRGDELKFSYGGHDDEFLLSEYGFVIGHAENEYNSVNVDKYIEALFASQGREGELKRGILEDADYWGDMTFQSHPTAGPSWRVLVALRLYHLRLPTSPTTTCSTTSMSVATVDALAPFYDVLTGTNDIVSKSNEDKVRLTVRAIATNVVVEAKRGIETCQELLLLDDNDDEVRGQQHDGQAEAQERQVDDRGGDDDDVIDEWVKMVREIWSGQETIASSILVEST